MSASATPVQRPLRADARRNRERILVAARRVFAAEGIDAQVDTVAREAGVGVGTVYRHFPDKEALLAELLCEKFARMAALVGEVLEQEGEPFELLADLLRRHCEQVCADAGLQHALRISPAEGHARALEQRARLHHLTERLLARACEAGTIRPDATVQDIVLLMCGVSATMALEDGQSEGWRRHLELCIDGLRAPSP